MGGRLIDADKLKKHYAWWQGGTLAKTLDEMKRDFDTIVDLQPTVEAEPVKHGRWIKDSEGWWHCSECGRQIPPKSKQDLNEFNKWCGRCGAKMDLDEVEE